MRTLLTLAGATAATALIGSAVSAPAGRAAQAQRPAEFANCAGCHKVKPNESSPLGPSLWKIGGRRAGATVFNYSPAMKGSRIVWTRATLAKFIMAPRQVVAGTRMPYAGMRDPRVAGAIADYLMALK